MSNKYWKKYLIYKKINFIKSKMILHNHPYFEIYKGIKTNSRAGCPNQTRLATKQSRILYEVLNQTQQQHRWNCYIWWEVILRLDLGALFQLHSLSPPHFLPLSTCIFFVRLPPLNPLRSNLNDFTLPDHANQTFSLL